MKCIFQKWILGLFCMLIFDSLHAQCPGWSPLNSVDSVFTNPAFGNATSPEIDRLQRPYVYLASVSGGVKIYNVSGTGPVLIATVAKTALGNLDAINLYQDSIWLYVTLGNIWNTNEMAGLAIVDISQPGNPSVLDVYSYPGLGGGAGAVSVRDKYAYLAANQNGLLILDISSKSDIRLKSSLALNKNFPHSNVGLTSMYNARGIALNGNYAYLCFDRGALRVIDISDVNAPVQINQYCFAPLVNKATAYNNIFIHKNIAYVSIDYYGLEILDISDPNHITQKAWWHPSSWADTTNDMNSWAASKGHANELAYDSVCKKIYLAAGKSDLMVIDVSNPGNPITCQLFGSDNDAYGTWGMDYFNRQICITYIWSVVAPPYSNYTGFKRLQKECMTSGLGSTQKQINNIDIYPNPGYGKVQLELNGQKLLSVKVLNMQGECLQTHYSENIDLTPLCKGVYLIYIETKDQFLIKKFIKQD